LQIDLEHLKTVLQESGAKKKTEESQLAYLFISTMTIELSRKAGVWSVATHCNTLQHTATHCNSVYDIKYTHYSTFLERQLSSQLQHTAIHTATQFTTSNRLNTQNFSKVRSVVIA